MRSLGALVAGVALYGCRAAAPPPEAPALVEVPAAHRRDPVVPVAATSPAVGVPYDLDGVTVTDVAVGAGSAIHPGDRLSVHYVGTLDGGAVFDSSRERGQPFEFSFGTGMVIKGWERGLLGMRVGGRRTLTIPSPLGYGHRGAPPKIPADATLHFDVEILEVLPPSAP